jgi:hypothetical protein
MSAYEAIPVAEPTQGAFPPPLAAPPRDAYVSEPLIAGAAYVDGVFPVRAEEFPGWLLEGMEHWDIINGKILIKPSRYLLGLVVDDLWRDGLIWNNRDASATVVSIDSLNDQGIVLSGIAPSDVIAARQDNTHTFQILREGPATIDAFFSFNFGVGEVSQTLSGFRGVVFPLRPRDAGYAEGREWHTSLYRSDNGTEKRSTLTNATPPRIVRFPVRAHRFDERALAENLLRFGSRYSFLVPLWFSASQLTAATNGTAEVSAATALREFAVDGYVALIRRGRNNPFATIRQVVSFTATTITFSEPVTAAEFSEGDWCIPAIVAAFPGGAEWSDRSSRLGDLQVVFEEL